MDDDHVLHVRDFLGNFLPVTAELVACLNIKCPSSTCWGARIVTGNHTPPEHVLVYEKDNDFCAEDIKCDGTRAWHSAIDPRDALRSATPTSLAAYVGPIIVKLPFLYLLA